MATQPGPYDQDQLTARAEDTRTHLLVLLEDVRSTMLREAIQEHDLLGRTNKFNSGKLLELRMAQLHGVPLVWNRRTATRLGAVHFERLAQRERIPQLEYLERPVRVEFCHKHFVQNHRRQLHTQLLQHFDLTVRHEFAHVMAGTGNGNPHGKMWRLYAKLFGVPCRGTLYRDDTVEHTHRELVANYHRRMRAEKNPSES